MSLRDLLKPRSPEDIYIELVKMVPNYETMIQLIQHNLLYLIGRLLKDENVDQEIRDSWSNLLNNALESIQSVLQTGR